MKTVDRRVLVETPELIQFSFDLAGPSTRMMAYLIDISIRGGLVFVLSTVIFFITGFAVPEMGIGLVLVLMFSVEWGYHTLFEWLMGGTTPGKRVLNIRVVRTNGVAVDLLRSAMRNLLRAADLFPFGYATGLLTMFLTRKERRLGDLAADTMVIRIVNVGLRELPPLPEEALELPTGALDRLKLKELDLALIDEFFRRRHLFSKERAEELAEILAAPISDRLHLMAPRPMALLAGVLLAGHERHSAHFESLSKGALS